MINKYLIVFLLCLFLGLPSYGQSTQAVTIDSSTGAVQNNPALFNGANQVVKMAASGKLPAVDGSLLTNLPAGSPIGAAAGGLTGTYPSPGLNSSSISSALGTFNLSVFGASTSSQLAGVISDETGTGALTFGTSPTLITPNLGTPSAINLANATGYTGSAGSIQGVAQTAQGGNALASVGSFTFTPEQYGGAADGQANNAIATTASSGVITAASGTFAASDATKAICIYDGVASSTACTLNATTTVTMTSTTGLYAGQCVTGGKGSISMGTTISSVTNGTTIVLNQAANLSGSFTLTFLPRVNSTTIASYQSSSQVTLTNANVRTNGAVRAIWGTDNTTAIQNAINACAAFTGGVVQLKIGIYVVAGPLRDASTFNSIIELPTTQNKLWYTIQGEGPSLNGRNGDNVTQSTPLTGTTIFGFTPASGVVPSVFCGNAIQAYGPITGVDHCFKNLGIEVPVTGGCSGINCQNADGLIVEDAGVSADILVWGEQLPATANYGIIYPNANNDQHCFATNVDVSGLGTGMYVDSNFWGKNIVAVDCNTGIYTTSYSTLNGAILVNNVTAMAVNGSSYINWDGIEMFPNDNGQWCCNFINNGAAGLLEVVMIPAQTFTYTPSIPVSLRLSFDNYKSGGTDARVTASGIPLISTGSGVGQTGLTLLSNATTGCTPAVLFRSSANVTMGELFSSEQFNNFELRSLSTSIPLTLGNLANYNIMTFPGTGTACSTLGDITVGGNAVMTSGHGVKQYQASITASGTAQPGVTVLSGSAPSQTVALTIPSAGLTTIIKNQSSQSWTVASSSGSLIVLPRATTPSASFTLPSGSMATFYSDFNYWNATIDPATGQTFSGNNGTPSVAYGTGANSPTGTSIAGNGETGTITFTTGAVPVASGTVLTATFASSFAYPTGCTAIVFPGNGNAALLSGTSMLYSTGTTTTFVLTSGTAALTALTTYTLQYQVKGY